MNETQKTHWKALMDKPYLGRWDFKPGEELLLTIKSVDLGEVYEKNSNKTKKKPIIHFVEDYKPLVLNTVNNITISKVTGSPFVEDWIGKKIYLRVEHIPPIKKDDEIVDEAIRVIRRTYQPIKCEECSAEIRPISGKTPAQIAEISKRNTGKVMCPSCMRKYADKESHS